MAVSHSSTPTRLILASGSPRRRELLGRLGVTFDIVVSDATELEHEHLTVPELCQLNAYRKARAVAKRHPDALVIGADTLVYLGTRAFGKPGNLAEATSMLQALQGRTHRVATGVCLIHLRNHRACTFADVTEVQFKRLSAAAIRTYLARVDPMDKAGSYAIQEHGERIVRGIVGSHSNVVGLPLERLEIELKRFGVRCRVT
jgi:septum formation protein